MPAKPGEPFRALNDEAYTLDPSNLVIADSAGAIALAGVIGGGDSAISEKTTRVVLESANFQASSIRKTSSAIKLRTDASMRFEKAQDPVNTVRGLARAVELLREISPGIRLVGGVADQMREMTPPPAIELSLAWLERKLGRTIEAAEVRRILESLAFGVTEAEPGIFSVTVPSWRATKDVAIKDDLVEEVGRMVGYDSITPQAPLVPAAVPPGNPSRRFQHDVRNLFVDNGFTEVYNYSFLSEESVRAFGFDPASHIRVTNPIASNQELMRATLLPGIWKNVTDNAKHRESFRLFEIGLEIHRQGAGLAGGDSAPGGGAVRSPGRRHLRTEAGGGMPDAGRADRARRGARLRASRARRRDPVEGRGGRTAVRTASQVRGDWAGGDPRSGSAAGGVAQRRPGRSTRRSGGIRRAPSTSR